MEDTHVWAIGADGSNRREIGRGIDNRQGAPEWSADGRAVLFTVQERGSSHLYRLPLTCSCRHVRGADGERNCPAEKIVGETGTVGAFSMARTVLAYTLSTPGDSAELYVAGPQADGSQRRPAARQAAGRGRGVHVRVATTTSSRWKRF